MKMNPKTKKIISFLVIIVALILIYLSSYLPFVKASLYIKALREQAGTKSVEEFIAPIEKAFNFYSPIGQPEEIRFFANNILNILVAKNDKGEQLPQDISKALVDYTVSILNSNPPGYKGLNYSQSFLMEATILSVYGQRFGDLEYLSRAEELYKKGLEISPKRPQFLYGLLGTYLAQNKKEEAKKIAEEIIKYWPQDERIKQLLESLDEF